MTQSRKNNRNNRKKSGSRMSGSESTLKRIEQYEKTQQKARLPSIPDIIPMIVSREKIFTTQRNYLGPNITPSTTIDTAGAISFSLSALGNSTEFTALFDLYRIIQAKVTFMPTSQVSSSTALWTFIDLDDAVTPVTQTVCLDYPTLQVSETGAVQERTLTPRPAVAAYSGVFTSFASPSSSMWIDAASPSVLYYGVKYYVPAQAGNNTGINWNTYIQLTVQGKNVH